MEITKYRLISAHGANYLQYLQITNLFFIKIKKWKYVFKAYCDKVTGRNGGYDSLAEDYPMNFFDEKLFVNDTNTDLKLFVKKYPNIDIYFEEEYKKQDELELIHKQWQIDNNKKNGIITKI